MSFYNRIIALFLLNFVTTSLYAADERGYYFIFYKVNNISTIAFCECLSKPVVKEYYYLEYTSDHDSLTVTENFMKKVKSELSFQLIHNSGIYTIKEVVSRDKLNPALISKLRNGFRFTLSSDEHKNTYTVKSFVKSKRLSAPLKIWASSSEKSYFETDSVGKLGCLSDFNQSEMNLDYFVSPLTKNHELVGAILQTEEGDYKVEFVSTLRIESELYLICKDKDDEFKFISIP